MATLVAPQILLVKIQRSISRRILNETPPSKEQGFEPDMAGDSGDQADMPGLQAG
jgi:hypothetical protein